MAQTQREMVLKHLQDYGSITSWEAIIEYGATRLSAIIYNLKKLGYGFLCEQVTRKNRYGRNVTFTRYHLVKKEKR